MSPFLHAPLAWAALGLATIPIIIHLINRRRLRRLDWAAMEFLLAALRKNRRRLRLEHLILLAIRVLLMVLIALLLARPLISDRGAGWLANLLTSEDKIFVIDDSLSMQQRQAGRTILERATGALADSLQRLADQRSRDRITITRTSRASSPLVRGDLIDSARAAALGDSVRRLSATATRMDTAGLIESVAEQVAETTEGAGRPRVISILTDLRAGDWTDEGGGADGNLAAAFERLLEGSEETTRIVLLDVGREAERNVAVTSARIEGARPTVDIPSRVAVELANHGTRPAHDLRVTLSYAPVEGAEAPSMVIANPISELGPGETARTEIPCAFRSTGTYRATVEVSGADDSLPEDNRLSFVFDVAEATDVLLVSGEPSSELGEGETDYLEKALAPSGRVTSGYRTHVVVEDNLPSGDLSGYGAIFLANVYDLPEAFVRRVGRYVRAGGVLVIAPGDQIDPVVYERALGTAIGPPDDEHPGRGLLPGELGDVVSRDAEPVGLVPSWEHPFFASLADGGAPIVQTVGFRRYFRIVPAAASRVVARLDDPESSPAILERGVDAGRVILFASALDAEWSDWPPNPSYLVVLQDMLKALGRDRQVALAHLAGTPIEIPIDITRYKREARYRDPGYPDTPERVLIASPRAGARTAPDEFRLLIEDTLQPGISTLTLSARDGRQERRALAVRAPAQESDLARITPERLGELYPDVPLRVVRETTGFAETGRGRFEVSDLLITLFIILLFSEGFLAWRFARHRQGRSPPAPPAPPVTRERAGREAGEVGAASGGAR